MQQSESGLDNIKNMVKIKMSLSFLAPEGSSML